MLLVLLWSVVRGPVWSECELDDEECEWELLLLWLLWAERRPRLPPRMLLVAEGAPVAVEVEGARRRKRSRREGGMRRGG